MLVQISHLCNLMLQKVMIEASLNPNFTKRIIICEIHRSPHKAGLGKIFFFLLHRYGAVLGWQNIRSHCVNGEVQPESVLIPGSNSGYFMQWIEIVSRWMKYFMITLLETCTTCKIYVG